MFVVWTVHASKIAVFWVLIGLLGDHRSDDGGSKDL
jgi:hypothetical protein